MTATPAMPIPPTRFSPATRAALHRRTLAVVVVSQVFGGAGLAAGVTVGALLAEQMLGGAGVAGLPAALFTLGSALAAFTVGRLSQRSGRRIGLATGFAVGALGATGIVVAAVVHSPLLLFVMLFVYGAGTATNLQACYAGTDLAPPRGRATAVSIAMVSTTLGAVAGPNSITLLGALATSIGIPALAGPFLLAAVAYALAGLILFTFLRPDPLLYARDLAHHDDPAPAPLTTATGPTSEAPTRDITSRHGMRLGAATMILSQITMVAIMTTAPVHMREHRHSLGEVGFVIGMHIGAMFLPSLVTGPLVDRVGRIPMALASAVTLLAAGLTAALAPADSTTLLTVALVLLGLGWNLGLISGTALIVDATTPDTRAKTQGSVDVLVAIVGAGGGAVSGLVVSVSSYATLSLAGGLLTLLLVPTIALPYRPRSTRTHLV